MLKNSGYDLGSEGFNFIADRLLYAYDKLVYKGDFDMATVGISYYENTRNNLVKGFPGVIDRLINAKQGTTQITKQAELVNWRNAIANGTQEATGNFPFCRSFHGPAQRRAECQFPVPLLLCQNGEQRRRLG
ncbi:hypothetical protein [Verrucomicrobium spinosum]|uniref:hypothetical protein n=1 Tax=Verrucomicrobium spinosum TaxID=2736 RepID=UPI000ABB064E|nr:hypothetical protein [Verrucomicrobium spinosum]